MKPPFFRTPFNYNTNDASDEHGLECKDPTLTDQAAAEECDINVIVERFRLTGEVPQLTELPTFGDFTGIFDYQTAMNAIVKGRETFMLLPAKLRARFHNDPQEFLAFCSDEENRDEARKLGLLKPDTMPAPIPGITEDNYETRDRRPSPETTQDRAPQGRAKSGQDAPPTDQKPGRKTPQDDR